MMLNMLSTFGFNLIPPTSLLRRATSSLSAFQSIRARIFAGFQSPCSLNGFLQGRKGAARARLQK
jgi:hypothetical protein